MFKVIAVGTDGSETADQAVKAAAELARDVGAELHVIVAYRPDRSGMAQASGAPMVETGAHRALRVEVAAQVGRRASTHGLRACGRSTTKPRETRSTSSSTRRRRWEPI